MQYPRSILIFALLTICVGLVLGQTSLRRTCFGVRANDARVCMGHGRCISFNTCECDSSHDGDRCEICLNCGTPPDCNEGYQDVQDNCVPVCFGKHANDEQVCSGNGICSDPDVCKCSADYTGETCSKPVAGCTGENCPPDRTCFGIPADDSKTCSGHGRCTGQDRCTCFRGWKGRECKSIDCEEGYQAVGNKCEPLCNGIPASDPNCCSGNGVCYAPDKCRCLPAYTGADCETASCDQGYIIFNKTCIPTCFGFAANETCCTCSGRGNCVDRDVCECFANFTGRNCSERTCPTGYILDQDTCIPTCNGTGANHTDIVCGGQGRCVDLDTCECNDGYVTYSNSCIPVCFDIPANETSTVCSGHGICIEPDVCNCTSPLYSGSRCSEEVTLCDPGFTPHERQCIPICYELPSNNSLVCSGHGLCVEPNVCNCSVGWTGDQCQTKDCPSGYILDNSTNECVPLCFNISSSELCCVCSGHGRCVSPDKCNCSSNWTGDSCATRNCPLGFVSLDNENCIETCFGIPKSNQSVCSGHGDCDAVDTCTCQGHFTGSKCDQCVEGWSGSNCSIPVCYGFEATNADVCSGHGICQAPNSCRCPFNWLGDLCETATCGAISANASNVCSAHGKCIGLDNCECNTGWYGRNCQNPTCDACFYGTCVGPNQCRCRAGYEGPSCNQFKCNGTLSSDSSVCTGHGQCISPNVCICPDFYTGRFCDIPFCNYIAANDSRVCNGQGRCVGSENCQCNQTFTGRYCEIPLCGCGKHGKCIEGEKDKCDCTCKCDRNWTGDKCQYTRCGGLLSSNPRCCNSRGTCVRPDRCVCKKGFYGKFCERRGTPPKFTCFGFPPKHRRVCGGHGVCVKKDTCCCFFGYSGRRCECQYKRTTVCPKQSDKCTCRFRGRTFSGSKNTCFCETPQGRVANNTLMCPPGRRRSLFDLQRNDITSLVRDQDKTPIAIIGQDNKESSGTRVYHGGFLVLVMFEVMAIFFL